MKVNGDDYERLGDSAEEFVDFDGVTAYMRMTEGRCSALELVGTRFLCTVYEQRPQTCRDLSRNSPQCEGEVATKGERPLSLLRRSR